MQQSKQQRARGRETGRRRKKVIEQQQQQQQKMKINYLVFVITTRGNRKQSLLPFILSLSISPPSPLCCGNTYYRVMDCITGCCCWKRNYGKCIEVSKWHILRHSVDGQPVVGPYRNISSANRVNLICYSVDRNPSIHFWHISTWKV